jgi:hypothetical protein
VKIKKLIYRLRYKKYAYICIVNDIILNDKNDQIEQRVLSIFGPKPSGQRNKHGGLQRENCAGG